MNAHTAVYPPSEGIRVKTYTAPAKKRCHQSAVHGLEKSPHEDFHVLLDRGCRFTKTLHVDIPFHS